MRRGVDGLAKLMAAASMAAALGGCVTTLKAPPQVMSGRPDPCSLDAANPDHAFVYAVDPEKQRVGCDVSGRSLAVHDEGQFRPIYGPFDPHQPLQPSKAIEPVIKTLTDRAKDPSRSGPLKILIFVHGGLVEHKKAVAAAEALAPGMIADGYEPVFLDWESGIASTYGDRLCCVRNGERWVGDAAFFAPVRAAGDIGASIARAFENYGQEWIRYKETYFPEGTRYSLSSQDEGHLCIELGEPGEGCLHLAYPPFHDDHINRLDRRLKAQTLPHTLFFPLRVVGVAVLPEVGTQAWDNMFRRTRLALQYATSGPVRPAGLPPPNKCSELTQRADDDWAAQRGTERSGKNSDRFGAIASGGFTAFFERLDCEIRQGDLKDAHVEIHFFGHSMGAIVGDEIIRRYPGLPWKRIVYMAAADSIRDFRSSVAPVLECASRPSQASARRCPQDVEFYSLMLHPLSESRELNVGGLPPQGSLLEWIDEMFGGPRTSEERTFGKWTNVEDTIQLFSPAARDRMHFRVFASQSDLRRGDDQERAEFAKACAPMPGHVFPENAPKGALIDASTRCHPLKHGEFTDYSFWREPFRGELRKP
jgi:hypothetical protein